MSCWLSCFPALSVGRCLRSFSVLVINSTCVSLFWTLLDNSSAPLFMVVQWSPLRQQDSAHHRGQSGDTWVRLPYTEHPTYLRGNMLSSLYVFVTVNTLFVAWHNFDPSFQVISWFPTSVASTCIPCLLMEKGSRCTLQVCTSMYQFFLQLFQWCI